MRFNIVPGQEFMLRTNLESEKFRSTFTQLHQLRQESERMKPIKSHKADIARVIMKEHNKECIKYFPLKDAGVSPVPVSRRIPRDELEEYLS